VKLNQQSVFLVSRLHKTSLTWEILLSDSQILKEIS
jgi:hypothetical protein